MAMELVTGYAGSAHITAADDGEFNASVIGSGKYVLNYGNKFAASVVDNNTVQIGTGDALFQGRHVIAHNAENVAIDSGTQSLNRHDIICIKYNRDSGTGVETAELAVLKGTAAGNPVDPTIPSGSILSGAATAYMPLWRIVLTGIAIGTPEKLYGDVLPTHYTAATGTVAASRVSGTLSTSNIPNHSAAKITSGQLALAYGGTGVDGSSVSANRVFAAPNGSAGAASFRTLDAADIKSGTLPASRGGTGATSQKAAGSAVLAALDTGTGTPTDDSYMIAESTTTPGLFLRKKASVIWTYIKSKADAVYAAIVHTHAATDITSGTLNVARIPSLPASKVGSGTLAVARGGTGADGSSLAANRVLASPASATGAAAYRALVADDIPNISAAKITSGTMSAARIGSGQLALARGGTGVDNTARTANTVFAAPNGAAGNASFRALVAADIPNLPASKITSGKIALSNMPYDILYSTSAGTTGSVTLSDTAANYSYLEVFYCTNDAVYGSVKISHPNNKTFCMQNTYVDSSANMFVKTKNMKVSGTSISNVGYAGHMVLHAGQEPTYQSTTSEFIIYLVLGWK